MFKGKYENCKQCSKGDHTNVLDFGTRADVESELTKLVQILIVNKNTI